LKFKPKVLLDTNTFLYAIRYGIDIYTSTEDALLSRCEFITLSRIIDELKELAAKGGFMGRIAEKAIEYAQSKCKIIDFNVERIVSTDKLIVEFVKLNPKVLVITNDRELRRTLRKMCVPTGYIDLESKSIKVEYPLF